MGNCISKAENGSENGQQSEEATSQKAKSSSAHSKPLPTFGFATDFDKTYTLGRELGRGQYGTTYRCVHKATDEEYAAKRIRKSDLTSQIAIDDVKKEYQILNILKGKPNIVQMFGAYESDKYVTLVLELCAGGELFQRLLDKGKYSEMDASIVMSQILQVVADCHVNGVIHRDLKPENFLYASKADDATLKLIDFGLSDFFEVSRVTYFSDVAGSAMYVAPEVLRRRYTASADLWSCGVIMCILLTGISLVQMPFWAKTEAGIFREVLRGSIDFKSGGWENVTKSAKSLVISLLNRDPEARVSATQALAHPWIAQASSNAPTTPLDIKAVRNMQRYVDYNRAKQSILVEIARMCKPEELTHLQRQFALMDTDNSGAITIAEMVEGISQLKTGEDGHTVYKAEDIIQAAKLMDVDQNGEIDYMEFVAAAMSTHQMSAGRKQAWLDRVRIVFDKIDEDGNGYITRDELAAHLGHGEDVVKLINEADKNGDGMIDYDEFLAMLRENVRAAPRSRPNATQ